MLNVRERLQEAWECVDCGREIAAGEVAIVHYSEVETGEEVDSVSCLRAGATGRWMEWWSSGVVGNWATGQLGNWDQSA